MRIKKMASSMQSPVSGKSEILKELIALYFLAKVLFFKKKKNFLKPFNKYFR